MDSQGTTDKSCILCKAPSYDGYHKLRTGRGRGQSATAKQWTIWASESGRYLCSALSLSPNSFQKFLTTGPYCKKCSCLVWDLHSTMGQLRVLERRLENLKAQIGNIIIGDGDNLQEGQASDEILERIAKELQRRKKSRRSASSSSQGQNFVKLYADEEVAVKQEVEVEEIEVMAEVGSWDEENVDRNPEDAISEDDVMDPSSRLHQDDNDVGDDTSMVKKQAKARGTAAGARPKRVRKLGDPKSQKRKKLHKGALFDSSGNRLCKLCPISTAFETLHAFARHMDEVHPEDVFKCNVCGRRYVSEEGVTRHKASAHGGSQFSLHCPICLQGLKTQDELASHEAVHSSANPFTCPTCSTLFTNAVDLRRHVLIHINAFHCPKPDCNKNYPTQELLDEHIKKHESYVNCDICGRTFQSISILSRHKMSHSDEKSFQCHLCPASFKYKRTFVRHVRCHTDERRYSCQICGKTFRHSGNRKAHEEIHSGLKPYACSVCGKTFAGRANMWAHVRQIHKGIPRRKRTETKGGVEQHVN